MANRILMIDNDMNESRKLKVELESEGYKVFISKNMEEGFLIINANDIDSIIIFDDNIDINKLKENKISSVVPIIGVFYSQVTDKLVEICTLLDDYIFSPFEREQLYLKIKNQTKIKELQDLIKEKESELKKVYKQLNDFSLVDKETGLYNEFYFKSVITKECDKADRYGYKLSGIAFSVDNNFNDNKVFSDAIIKLINAMEAIIRKSDIFVRIDENLFYVMLPYTGLKEALFVADKLRKCGYRINAKDEQKLTVSFGVTILDDIDRGMRKCDEMIKRAQQSLKKAVESGGDRIECE